MLKFANARIDVGSGRPPLLVNLDISAGQRVLLAGPNGSGKTSIFDAAIGLRQLSSGKVSLQTSLPVAYVVQDTLSGLLPWLSAEDNILLPSRLLERDQSNYRARALSLQKKLRVEGLRNSLPFRLSGGERQLVNLIRCACTPADLVFLDEPFASLHSQTRRSAIENIMPSFVGKTILMVSHDADDLHLEFDRFFLLDGKQLGEAAAKDVRDFLEKVA